ncbi:hypothetical protein [Streptomyces acidiscabies]|uniref:Uncharacterized protein n=1 Tax=Streptomyces acidiscabies TaxID=42234 RepID=A0AAP6EGZ5_9ACTN|nr:hypothetical protein [Streptomyces acidiscabies]MBZ3910047.1 hypothetical protein [Streptomyces acidiscabies]MDX2962478.1 hypothetical protein [Streptomyces acidiscabies]MDX3020391.1 hypothetical protein [Streptomyces acidiscabies]MDX3789859.1 hypothetical protein [Streptomyces acidiscabies]GAQ52156.1 hypothetical protein a10_01937 [Streptomyces acidiscabies]
MRSRGYVFRLTAVSALVVLALTGFSSGRGHGSHSGGGGGGGCSSSRQDHDSSSSTSGGSSGGSHYRDYDDDSSSSSGGSSGSSTHTPVVVEDARVSLVSCATRKAPYMIVKVTNPNKSVQTFEITVRFLDARGAVIAEPVTEEIVGGKKTEEVRIPVGSAGLAAQVDRCEVEPAAPTA